MLDFLGRLLLPQSHCSLHSRLSCLHPLDSVLINHIKVGTYLFLLAFPCFWNMFFEVFFPNEPLGFIGDDANVSIQVCAHLVLPLAEVWHLYSCFQRTNSLLHRFFMLSSQSPLTSTLILIISPIYSFAVWFPPVSLQCRVTHSVICPCCCCLLCRHSELRAFFLETPLLYPKGCNWLCLHFNFLLRTFNCLPDFSMIIQEFIVQTPHVVLVSLALYF